mmetsp:Transcript_122891/g.236945  ORF Transcript_122891/g.236945 Transcript_122891/m.236945 type:complete len:92 (-) Transcript_122891:762-1037(-)
MDGCMDGRIRRWRGCRVGGEIQARDSSRRYCAWMYLEFFIMLPKEVWCRDGWAVGGMEWPVEMSVEARSRDGGMDGGVHEIEASAHIEGNF